MGLTGTCAACVSEESDSDEGWQLQRHGGIATRAAVIVDVCREVIKRISDCICPFVSERFIE